MSAKVVMETEELENVVLESWYSGERFIVRNQSGFLAAIVPLEDLAVLEEIEKECVSKANDNRSLPIRG